MENIAYGGRVGTIVDLGVVDDEGKVVDELGDTGVGFSLDFALECANGDGILDDFVIVGKVSSIGDAPEEDGGVIVPGWRFSKAKSGGWDREELTLRPWPCSCDL